MASSDFIIGIIGEGPTDHEVLQSIIVGYTGNKNLAFTPLQPKEGEPGNWDRVLKYCASSDFKSAFTNPDLIVVVQIDTDVFGTAHVPKEQAIAGMERMAVSEIVAAMQALLIAQMSEAFYKMIEARLIFAIAVHETECWFLPAYFNNDPKKAANPKNCIENLNKQLARANEGFYIDGKDLHNYRKLCRHFKKKKDILAFGKLNESLGIFVRELDKLPAMAEESDCSLDV